MSAAKQILRSFRDIQSPRWRGQQTVPQVQEDLMKRATRIVTTLSHHRPAGDTTVGATIGLAIGVFGGATLHRLGPRLHSLPRAPPSGDDGEPQAGSFSTRLAVARLPQIPRDLTCVSWQYTRLRKAR